MVMKKRLSSVLLALATVACTHPDHVANRGVETVKVPVVETSRFTYDLIYGAAGRLSDAQLRALDDYLGTMGVAYGDRIAIDDAGRTGAGERRQAVAGVVAGYGLLLDGTTPVTAGGVAPGSLRVVVTRSRASVPGCPDWSRPSEYEPEAAAFSNYGCAVRGNLAEMIADPNDLIVGRSYSGADGQTASSAVGAHRSRGGTSAAGGQTPASGGLGSGARGPGSGN